MGVVANAKEVKSRFKTEGAFHCVEWTRDLALAGGRWHGEGGDPIPWRSRLPLGRTSGLLRYRDFFSHESKEIAGPKSALPVLILWSLTGHYSAKQHSQ